MEFIYNNLGLLFVSIVTIIVVVLGWLTFYTGLPSKKAIMAIIQDELNNMPLNRNGSPINTMKIKGSALFSKETEIIVLKRLIVVFPNRRICGLKFKSAPCIMFDTVSLKDRMFSNFTYFNIFRVAFWESTNTVTFWLQPANNDLDFKESYLRIKFKGEEQKAFVKMMYEHSLNWYSNDTWNENSNEDTSSMLREFWTHW